MPASTLILTIAPGRNGEATMSVSFRNADGTQTPPREVVLDNRLAGFIANMQAFARAKLATLESPPQGRAEDGDPAIAVEAAHGEQVR